MAEGASAKKKIWVTALILTAITALEFIIAGVMGPGNLKIALFIGLTIIKAFYIVSVFMHLGDEVKRLAWSIILPFIFIMWFLIAMTNEGNSYGNNALKDANIKIVPQAAPAGGHGGGHGEEHNAPAHEQKTPDAHKEAAPAQTPAENHPAEKPAEHK